MNRITAIRILAVLSIACALSAAYHTVQAQSLRWPDAEPGTSRILWYGGAVFQYAVWVLALGYAAIRPGKASGTVLIVAAAMFFFAAMMTVAKPPTSNHMNFMLMAIPLFMAGIGLRRLSATERAA